MKKLVGTSFLIFILFLGFGQNSDYNFKQGLQKASSGDFAGAIVEEVAERNTSA